MACYSYFNPITKETIHLNQSMTEEHRYFKDGIEWERIFYKPNAAIDSKWDANSSSDFVAKSAKKRGTINDLWDKSKELSEIRKEKMGKDEVKEKYYENFAKARNGKEHPDIKALKLKESLGKKGISIE